MDEDSFYKQNTLPTFQEKEKENHFLPSKIGPYKIETLLNKGGMSLLYLGTDPETKKPLAIKVLSPEFLNQPEMASHFLSEAKIISLASHPNIVKLYGQGKWEQGLYIAMEFINGISLRQFILQQSFSLKRTLEIVLQVAYALSHLHSHGVIHRDLKPENVLITEDGEVKVIDFGIAQLHEDKEKQKSTLAKQMIGTPTYMSPEQKENPANVSFASDIYSLGVITYELILGKLSYGMINLSLLPHGLQKIVGKALAVSVKERYQDVVEFISDLSAYLKSPQLEQERPGTDQVKEFLESIQTISGSLSSQQLPNWPQVEIGIAKQRTSYEMGLYFDFFKFANGTYAILIAETLSSDISGSIHIALFRGIFRTLIHEFTTDPKKIVQPTKILQTINELLAEDRIQEKFGIGFLLLDPLRDSLSLIAAGMGPLLHIPQGSRFARKLFSKNPLIGVDSTLTFTETVDNWNEGDLLIFHSLETGLETSESFDLEFKLTAAAEEHALLSPPRAADAILQQISTATGFDQQRHPKVLMTLLRIG